MTHDVAAIILAAGKGARMKSTRAKVLHPVSGRPMVFHVLRAVCGLTPEQILVVIDPQNGASQSAFEGKDVKIITQNEPLGTGHAVLQAEGKARAETLLIAPGDLPLLTTEVLQTFLRHHDDHRADLSVLTMIVEKPGAYGRLVRDGAGAPIAIIEARDASEEELEILEVNTGIYCVRNDDFLWHTLASLDAGNAQGEYYLTDLVERYNKAERRVMAFPVGDVKAVMGVNSRYELAEADRTMRLEKIEELMASGVTIIDPERTYIDSEATVGADTTILPGTHLVGASTIGERCIIGPDAWIERSTIEAGCRVWYAAIEESRVRENTSVGPYAHLRPGADVGPDGRIGNFVEVKASRVKRGAKAGHLTYLGDAEVGEDANIGAGTITCNYDGEKKHRTTIGDRAFIGSNAALVAPIRIGNDAVIGAGSTITEDVPPGTLALGRVRQVIKALKKKPKEEEGA